MVLSRLAKQVRKGGRGPGLGRPCHLPLGGAANNLPPSSTWHGPSGFLQAPGFPAPAGVVDAAPGRRRENAQDAHGPRVGQQGGRSEPDPTLPDLRVGPADQRSRPSISQLTFQNVHSPPLSTDFQVRASLLGRAGCGAQEGSIRAMVCGERALPSRSL